jgi:S1-C subfamily serine protease
MDESVDFHPAIILAGAPGLRRGSSFLASFLHTMDKQVKMAQIMMDNRRVTTLLIVGMGLVTIVLVSAAVFLFLSGPNSPFAKETQVLRAYVQAPPVAEVGQETSLIVTVHNPTKEYLSIDEIRLPDALLEAADVAAIIPGTLNHTDYEGETGYQIGFLMAPDDQRQFEISLIPRQMDDFVGDVRVLAGDQETATGFRMVFEMPVALAPTLPPATATIPPSPSATLPPTLTPSATPLVVPWASVVKITGRIKHSSYLKDIWGGSGAIISEDGLILTNAHIISQIMDERADFYMVSITEDPAAEPVDMYFAEPLIVDKDLDLAVLRIATDLKQKPIDPADLHLTPIPLGDSSALHLGDPLFILGYPTIGGRTVTLSRGEVSGFTLSSKLTEPAYIKTTAMISGGTSGGLALDQYGRLVAVPTQLGYGQRDPEDLVDCRVAADTNRDGHVDGRDVCIPVGGFVNALRPVNLAKPLIDRALGVTVTSGGTPYPYPSPVP